MLGQNAGMNDWDKSTGTSAPVVRPTQLKTYCICEASGVSLWSLSDLTVLVYGCTSMFSLCRLVVFSVLHGFCESVSVYVSRECFFMFLFVFLWA